MLGSVMWHDGSGVRYFVTAVWSVLLYFYHSNLPIIPLLNLLKDKMSHIFNC